MQNIEKFDFIKRLAGLPFVEAIYLFGSRARQEERPRSDIDLAIDCPSATNQDWQEVMDIIENADTLLSIDCIRLDKLSDNILRGQIEAEKKLIYRKAHE